MIILKKITIEDGCFVVYFDASGTNKAERDAFNLRLQKVLPNTLFNSEISYEGCVVFDVNKDTPAIEILIPIVKQCVNESNKLNGFVIDEEANNKLLQFITDGNHAQVEKLLRENRYINPNICNEEWVPPLFIAAKRDDIKMIDLLLLHGADPTTKINGKYYFELVANPSEFISQPIDYLNRCYQIIAEKFKSEAFPGFIDELIPLYQGEQIPTIVRQPLDEKIDTTKFEISFLYNPYYWRLFDELKNFLNKFTSIEMSHTAKAIDNIAYANVWTDQYSFQLAKNQRINTLSLQAFEARITEILAKILLLNQLKNNHSLVLLALKEFDLEYLKKQAAKFDDQVILFTYDKRIFSFRLAESTWIITELDKNICAELVFPKQGSKVLSAPAVKKSIQDELRAKYWHARFEILRFSTAMLVTLEEIDLAKLEAVSQQNPNVPILVKQGQQFFIYARNQGNLKVYNLNPQCLKEVSFPEKEKGFVSVSFKDDIHSVLWKEIVLRKEPAPKLQNKNAVKNILADYIQLADINNIIVEYAAETSQILSDVKFSKNTKSILNPSWKFSLADFDKLAQKISWDWDTDLWSILLKLYYVSDVETRNANTGNQVQWLTQPQTSGGFFGTRGTVQHLLIWQVSDPDNKYQSRSTLPAAVIPDAVTIFSKAMRADQYESRVEHSSLYRPGFFNRAEQEEKQVAVKSESASALSKN